MLLAENENTRSAYLFISTPPTDKEDPSLIRQMIVHKVPLLTSSIPSLIELVAASIQYHAYYCRPPILEKVFYAGQTNGIL